MKIFLVAFFFLDVLSCSRHIKGLTYDPEATEYSCLGYTLLFQDGTSGFNADTKRRLVETFFKVYPKLAADFNTNAAQKVVFKIDSTYKGVAATSQNVVRYDPAWFKKNPEDIDVVTHEVMHIVQSYGKSVGPWWLIEGIADYVREVYGINNTAAKWNLHAPRNNEKYDNGYRVTARFLLWIERKVKPGFVKLIDAALRDHTYTSAMWQQYTGKTADALWADYMANPAV